MTNKSLISGDALSGLRLCYFVDTGLRPVLCCDVLSGHGFFKASIGGTRNVERDSAVDAKTAAP
jgi:hypothetical protein